MQCKVNPKVQFEAQNCEGFGIQGIVVGEEQLLKVSIYGFGEGMRTSDKIW